jgi:hypothetical protein
MVQILIYLQYQIRKGFSQFLEMIFTDCNIFELEIEEGLIFGKEWLKDSVKLIKNPSKLNLEIE